MSPSKEAVVQEFRIRSIQEAAMRVIARKGMSAATMADIANEAGIAKGTIYLYFRDRDALVTKTFETAIGELHARIDEALAIDRPIHEKIRAMMSAQIRYFNDNAEFFRLYMSLRMPEGNAAQQRRQKRQCAPQYLARVNAFADILKRGMSRGEVRKADPRRLALFLIEGSIAITFERLHEDAPPPEEQDIDLIVSTILDGIFIRKQKRSGRT